MLSATLHGPPAPPPQGPHPAPRGWPRWGAWLGTKQAVFSGTVFKLSFSGNSSFVSSDVRLITLNS